MRVIRMVLIAAALLPGFSAALSAEPLHMVTAAQPPLGPSPGHPGFLGSVAREAFQRIGVTIDVAALPGERAMINVNTGVDDGELMRNPEIEPLYPELLRVPEAIYRIDIMGFSLENRPGVRGFADLAPFGVAYVAGRKAIEDDIKAARQSTAVRNLEDLFLLLKQGRTDIVIAERWQGISQARRLDMQVVALEPPFRSTEMFIYLNKRHAAIVPRLAAALADMKKDGTYRQLLETALGARE